MKPNENTQERDRTGKERSARSRWNLRVGRFLGIDVYLHVTFLILLAVLALAHGLPERSLGAAMEGVAFFLAIFGCVLLHEYGHALAAREYGVKTRDITLLPIGGVARLERMPDKPVQEFWIALAGPIVNVVIAAVLVAVLAVTGSLDRLLDVGTTQGGFLERLIAVNLFLVLFNMLPAFPMDGGRVLRAVLAMRMEYVKATRIAGRIGQVMACAFGVTGFFGNPMLILIAFFVWMGATGEMGAAQARSALAGVPVSQAMVTEFEVLHPTDTLGLAARHVLAGSQQDFPVVQGVGVVGLLERRHLVDGLARLGPEGLVGEVMVREFPVLHPDEMVEPSLAAQQLHEFPMLPVLQDGRLVGLLTLENLSELLLITSALRDSGTSGPRDRGRRTTSVPPVLAGSGGVRLEVGETGG